MAGYQERTVVAGGIPTRYVEAGAGETVLLLHSVDPGGSGTLEYRKNIDALARDFHLIVPDLIGFAGTDLPDRPLGNTSDEYTNHIIALMDALGIERAHLVGNSRGGLISLAIMVAQPERVGRIVLLANAGGAVTKEYREAQEAKYANFRPTRDEMREFLSGSYYSLDRDMPPEVFDEYCANALVQYARYDKIGGLRGDVPDLRPQLAEAKHPILYVFGANDERWPPVHDGLDIFLNTPGAKYYITSNCGHHPQIEASNEINLLMASFLSGKMDPR